MNARKRRSDEVVAELLLAQLNTIRANLDGAIAGEDPEALHELRVAVRRSRTLLKGFPSVFAPADHTRFTNEFKELQGLTGPVRDHDVLLGLVAEFSGERPELASETAALRRELERQRGLARNKLKRRLTSQRFAKLLDGWQATLEGLDNEGAPIGKLAADRIVTDHEHLLALSAAALESGDPLAVHHARKRAKALRYKLEFFGRFGEKNETRSLIYKL
jgi:CHAD domain-containing protein